MGDGEAAPAIETLFGADTIAGRIEALAAEIAGARLRDPVIVAILKGSFIFAADLIRALHRQGLAPDIDFMFLASYGAGTSSQGEVRIVHDIEGDLTGRDIVLVDDILDSGRTLALAKALLQERGAARVLSCVLIDKRVPRASKIEADFVGFPCGAVFVVGYGMDLGHRYRELPFIGTVTNSTESTGT